MEELLRDLTGYFQRLTGCQAIGIRLRQGEDFPYYQTQGFPPEFVRAENSLCARDSAGELLRDSAGNPVLDCMCGSILCGRFDPAKPFFTSHGSFWTNCTSELLASTTEADRQARTRNRCNGEGYESVALVPIRVRGQVLGLYQFNDKRKGQLSAEQMELLEQLADYTAIALAKLQAEDSLRESEARFRSLFENALDAIFLTLPDGSISAANPAACDMFGRSEEELRQIGRAGVMNRHDPRLTSALRERARTGRFRGELSLVRKDGSEFDGEVQSVVVDGQTQRCFVMVRDISQQKHTAEELRRSEARYRSLFENMLEGLAYCRMVFVDGRPEDFVYLSVNAAFTRLTGLKEVAGKPVSQVIPGLKEAHPELLATYARVALTGRPERFEILLESLGVWLAVSVYSTEKEHFVAVFDNVTERKQSEEALRASESLYHSLVENLPQNVFRKDLAGRFTFVNQRFCQLVGKASAEILGKTDLDLFPRAAAAKYQQDDQRVLETAQALEAEEEYCVAARPPLAVRVIKAPLRNSQGNIVGLQGIFWDVTAQKLLEEQLRQAQKMEAIGQLAGGVAHDFRNQLTVIKGYGEMLLRRAMLGEEGRLLLDEILRAANRGVQLTSQLLAFSRKDMLQPRVVNLSTMVGEMAGSLGRLVGEDIAISIKNDGQDCLVNLSANQFEHAMMNLAANARDAMPYGGQLEIATARVELDEAAVNVHPHAKPGNYVMLSVRDTGVGMDKQTLLRLFEPFFTTKEVGKGTGLGLPMVYGFVRQSGGIVNVESEVGKGTTVRLYFPYVAGGDQPVAERVERGQAPGGSETILVVEDEEPIRRLLVESLQEAGYAVMAATDARQAGEIADHHQGRINLLITDVVMPGGSGVELVNRLRSGGRDIPVIFVSGYGGEELSSRGIDLSKATLLVKPFRHEQLIQTVRRRLDTRAPSL